MTKLWKVYVYSNLYHVYARSEVDAILQVKSGRGMCVRSLTQHEIPDYPCAFCME